MQENKEKLELLKQLIIASEKEIFEYEKSGGNMDQESIDSHVKYIADLEACEDSETLLDVMDEGGHEEPAQLLLDLFLKS